MPSEVKELRQLEEELQGGGRSDAPQRDAAGGTCVDFARLSQPPGAPNSPEILPELV